MALFKKKKKQEEEFKEVEVPQEIIEKSEITEQPIIEEEIPEQAVEQPQESNLENPNSETDNEILELEEKLKDIKLKKEMIAKGISSKIMVVKELPEAPIRNYKDKDGSIISLITIEEALGEILNLLKK